MTVNELSQLYHLNREIDRLTSDLDRLNRLSKKDIICDSVKGSSAFFPYTEHNIMIHGIEGGYKITKHDLEIAELKGLLELSIKKAYIERTRLERYISEIDNCEVRQIIALRYVNGLPWRQVALHVGGYATEDSVRQIHQRHLKKRR